MRDDCDADGVNVGTAVPDGKPVAEVVQVGGGEAEVENESTEVDDIVTETDPVAVIELLLRVLNVLEIEDDAETLGLCVVSQDSVERLLGDSRALTLGSGLEVPERVDDPDALQTDDSDTVALIAVEGVIAEEDDAEFVGDTVSVECALGVTADVTDGLVVADIVVDTVRLFGIVGAEVAEEVTELESLADEEPHAVIELVTVELSEGLPDVVRLTDCVHVALLVNVPAIDTVLLTVTVELTVEEKERVSENVPEPDLVTIDVSDDDAVADTRALDEAKGGLADTQELALMEKLPTDDGEVVAVVNAEELMVTDAVAQDEILVLMVFDTVEEIVRDEKALAVKEKVAREETEVEDDAEGDGDSDADADTDLERISVTDCEAVEHVDADVETDFEWTAENDSEVVCQLDALSLKERSGDDDTLIDGDTECDEVTVFESMNEADTELLVDIDGDTLGEALVVAHAERDGVAVTVADDVRDCAAPVGEKRVETVTEPVEVPVIVPVIVTDVSVLAVGDIVLVTDRLAVLLITGEDEMEAVSIDVTDRVAVAVVQVVVDILAE